jgi:hypothetical protein
MASDSRHDLALQHLCRARGLLGQILRRGLHLSAL